MSNVNSSMLAIAKIKMGKIQKGMGTVLENVVILNKCSCFSVHRYRKFFLIDMNFSIGFCKNTL